MVTVATDNDTKQVARRPKAEGAVPRRQSRVIRLRSGMRFESGIPFEDWQRLGTYIATYSNSSMWWLGDWLEFGREMYGSRYKLGISLTGLEYKTLRNYAYVARRIDMSRRRDRLSFQHHAEVAALVPAEQERWLSRAEDEGWTRAELRHRMRVDLRLMPQPVGRFSVVVLAAHPWARAASRCGRDVDSWIRETLDEAAAAVLET